jgi:hypothetical protein
MEPNVQQPVEPSAPSAVPQASQVDAGQPAPKVGRISRGWQLTKSAWQVLLLDKELAALPILGMITSVVVLAVFIAATLAVLAIGGNTFGSDSSFGNWTWVVIAALYIVMTTIGNFFAGAVIAGAMTRFKGGDPTVKSSLQAVRQKFKPLLLYSVMMSTVGLVLQVLEERVPLAGRIAIWLVNAAWNVANFFALPIIVLSDTNVMPFSATKQSVAMVRKVWGESVVAEAGISIIAVLTIIPYVVLGGALSVGLAATGVTPIAVAVLVGLLVLGLFGIILVTSVLGGIVKAALYHFATTGQAPDTFNRSLLRTAMTPKKARRLFA